MAIVSLICSIISSFASLEYLGIEKDPHSVRHYFTIMSNKMGALHHPSGYNHRYDDLKPEGATVTSHP